MTSSEEIGITKRCEADGALGNPSPRLYDLLIDWREEVRQFDSEHSIVSLLINAATSLTEAYWRELFTPDMSTDSGLVQPEDPYQSAMSEFKGLLEEPKIRLGVEQTPLFPLLRKSVEPGVFQGYESWLSTLWSYRCTLHRWHMSVAVLAATILRENSGEQLSGPYLLDPWRSLTTVLVCDLLAEELQAREKSASRMVVLELKLLKQQSVDYLSTIKDNYRGMAKIRLSREYLQKWSDKLPSLVGFTNIWLGENQSLVNSYEATQGFARSVQERLDELIQEWHDALLPIDQSKG